MAGCLFVSYASFGQVNLNSCTTIEFKEPFYDTQKDLYIGDQVQEIKLTLRGGDGGDAVLKGVFCDTRVKGGEGATVVVSYLVGAESGKLQPGGVLRSFIGQRGNTTNTDCDPNPVGVYGGGGGASGVVYLPPGKDPNGPNWIILAVAGGGGGGARPIAGTFRVGQGGNGTSAGDNVVGAQGGSDGGCASSGLTAPFKRGFAGGSVFCEGIAGDLEEGKSMLRFQREGNQMVPVSNGEGGYQLKNSNAVYAMGGHDIPLLGVDFIPILAIDLDEPAGGYGFVGGGSGSGGGGGGGGYSGGAGATGYGGGGGGSYYSVQFLRIAGNWTHGRDGEGSLTHGYIRVEVTATSTEESLECGIDNLSCNMDRTFFSASGDDFIIPSGIGTISLELKGGDGGTASLISDATDNSCSIIGTGGEGATVKATFMVGESNSQLRPGGRIRYYAGEAGGSPFFSDCFLLQLDPGPSLGAGGGGSSAVLYLPPAGGEWKLLAVAGAGGGGGFRPDLLGNDGVRTYTGGGGRASESGQQIGENAYGSSGVPCPQGTEVNNGPLPGTRLVNFAGGGYQCYYADFQLWGTSVNSSSDYNSLLSPNNKSPYETGGMKLAPYSVGGIGFTGGGSGVSESSGGGGGFYGGSGGGGGGGSFITNTYQNSNAEKIQGADGGGTMANGYVRIRVQENVPPTALCKDITVYLEADGTVAVPAASLDNESSDNCGSVSFSFAGAADQLVFACTDIGSPRSVTLTVTDESGNQATCPATITVVDNAPPFFSGELNVLLENNSGVTISESDIPASIIADGCGVASFEILGRTTFGCADVGRGNPVEVKLTDIYGNTAVENLIVNVEDATPPVITTRNITRSLDANGNASVAFQDVVASVDECSGGTTSSISKTSFDCSDLGENTVNVTVTDRRGNSSTETAIVTIVDNTKPSLVCPTNKTVVTNTDNCTHLTDGFEFGLINVVPGVPTPYGYYADNCAELLTTFNDFNHTGSLANAEFPLGLTEVSWTVTDKSGNASSCTFSVTVSDGQVPQLDPATCPPSVVLEADPNLCGQVFNYELPVFIDDCDPNPVVQPVGGYASGAVFPIGSTILQFTAVDQAGNKNEFTNCLTTVRVVDAMPPVARCKENFTVAFPFLDKGYLGNSVNIQPYQLDDGSYDQCGGIQLALSKYYFTCSELGENIVTLTVYDQAGNSSTCQSKVFVDDNPPKLSCKDITINVESGPTTIAPDDVWMDGYWTLSNFTYCHSENPPVLSLDRNSFSCADVGATIPVTLTSVDFLGRTNTCQSNVQVIDGGINVSCGLPINVVLEDGQSQTIDLTNRYTVTDNCGIASVSLEQESITVTCADYGQNLVNVTATDINGNTGSCNIRINVSSTWKAKCTDVTVDVDESGLGTLNLSDAFSYGDPCPEDPNDYDQFLRYSLFKPGASVLSLDNTFPVSGQIVYTTQDIGVKSITMLIYDSRTPNENRRTCYSLITVREVLPPVAACQDITVELDDFGSAGISPEQVDGGSSAQTAEFTLSLDKDHFDCGDLNANLVTLTITDDNGKSSSCEATVTVIGSQACCSDGFLFDKALNSCLDIDECDLGIADCPENSVCINTPGGYECECLPGYTKVDGVCVPCVTAVCKDIVVQLGDQGIASIRPEDVDNGSSNACDPDGDSFGLWLDVTDFDCSNIGDNTVTLTIADENEVSASCKAKVKVVDDIAPTAVCATGVSVTLGDDGAATISPRQIDHGSSDACGIASFSLNNANFDCSQRGSQLVTLTVVDKSGNTSTCTATVTVVDDAAPVPDLAILPDAIGECGVELTAPTATDNCAGTVTATTTGTVIFSGQGSYLVTWTYDDGNGNTSNQTQTVIVKDVTAPVIADILIPVDPIALGDGVEVSAAFSENCSVVASWDWGDASSDPGTVSGSQVTGNHTYAAPGVYIVRLTLTDPSGTQVTERAAGYVVVYDPNGNYVVGNGWINSPPGALVSDPDATGKAFFGFSSEYKKGANVPTGDTDFRFKAGDFRFRSTEYEWLVIAGENAKFKGSGTVNDQGYYQFMLTAKDGDLSGQAGPDEFRIKIWQEVVPGVEEVVYDNVQGADDLEYDAQVISDGRIAIKQRNGNGKTNLSASVPEGPATIEKSLELKRTPGLSAFPNPFSSQLTIRFSLPEAGPASLLIFDLQGRLIRQLQSGQLDAGDHQQQWNGDDQSGRALPAGVYFIQLRSGEEVVYKKVLLQRL